MTEPMHSSGVSIPATPIKSHLNCKSANQWAQFSTLQGPAVKERTGHTKGSFCPACGGSGASRMAAATYKFD